MSEATAAPRKRSAARTLSALGALAALLAAVQIWASSRVVVLKPVPALPASAVVHVEEGAEGRGPFLVSVVALQRANLIEVIRSVFDRTIALRRLDETVPGGLPWQAYEEYLEESMRDSGELAAAVAMRHLGFRVDVRQSVRVVHVPGPPGTGGLRVGDVIEAIDGRPVHSEDDARQWLEAVGPETRAGIAVVRAGERLIVDWPASGAATGEVQSLMLATEYDATLGRGVDVDAAAAGGSSAGLMLALEIVRQVSPDAFGTGIDIPLVAGTGSLRLDGSVRPVDGVAQKIVAAERAGARYFLVPRANVDEARRAARVVEVVPVDTFDQAVALVPRLLKED